jgi:hypothetical protein
MFDTKKHIAGTEGTHNYVVIAEGEHGLVAVRLINGSNFRVRVEPSSEDGAKTVALSLTRANDWKQPGDSGQNRFSTVCLGGAELYLAVAAAVKAIASQADDFEGALAAIVMVGTTSRDELIKRAREANLPGVNSASKWTTTTLVAKLSAAPEAEHGALVGFVKAAKVAGANLAANWAVSTLRRKALALA